MIINCNIIKMKSIFYYMINLQITIQLCRNGDTILLYYLRQ